MFDLFFVWNIWQNDFFKCIKKYDVENLMSKVMAHVWRFFKRINRDWNSLKDTTNENVVL